ncbi:hypothetical protein CDIK_1117 [Cucumispora dikerogammari]|nr:hypothetical protein CDIK_1117 [Cucumispora dikerogammari]
MLLSSSLFNVNINNMHCIIPLTVDNNTNNNNSKEKPFTLTTKDLFVYGEASKSLRKKTVPVADSSNIIKYSCVNINLHKNTFKTNNKNLRLTAEQHSIVNSIMLPITRLLTKGFYRFSSDKYYCKKNKDAINTVRVIVTYSVKKFISEIDANVFLCGNTQLKIKELKIYLAKLLGNVFHGTDFLKTLVSDITDENSKDMSIGRGVVQVSHLANYKLISEISKTHKLGSKSDYAEQPELLGEYTEEAIVDSLLLYDELCKRFIDGKVDGVKNLSFIETVRALGVQFEADREQVGERCKELDNRLKIYEFVCVGLDIFPQM